ncbi:EAL domain-containing protein [Vibrio sp. 99-70-13A1]|uniref:EAL domain-containing protein n=1 Tax=Vibrio sp. 99-70-13A1 TaxID=2607601 RepID=UPI0020A340CB|nr:EAL domain-containing protein [Vibrio sp. 99-70-13A1]
MGGLGGMNRLVTPQRLAGLFDSGSEGLWFMSDDNVVQFYNNTFYKQFNVSLTHTKFDDWLELVHPEDKRLLKQDVDIHQKDKVDSRVTTRYRVKNRSGCYVWIEATGLRIEERGGLAMVGTHKDISEATLINDYLMYTADHDSETGLPNRKLFLQTLSKLGEEQCIIVCCLTHLRQFQRQVGVDATRQLVSILVSTLDHFLSSKYELYRISWDVFIAVVEKPSNYRVGVTLMSQIEKDFQSRGQECNSTVMSRLGVGYIPVKNISRDLLLKNIFDLSEYVRLVRSPIAYLGDEKEGVDRYFEVLDSLKYGIDSHQLSISLQPIVEVSTGSIISFEALARWQHDKLGNIPPSEFIPIAENMGYIHALGMEVLELACEFLDTHDNTSLQKPLINVNISGYQLLKTSFVDDVLASTLKFGINPERVVIEITESYLLEEEPIIMSTLNSLHRHGFKLSIDDFGSGMSAFTSLYRLPLYQIKLDRALANEVMKLDACSKLVAYLCDFCLLQGVKLVAEGVESKEMLTKLTSLGVPYLQGYYLYKPSWAHAWLERCK